MENPSNYFIIITIATFSYQINTSNHENQTEKKNIPKRMNEELKAKNHEKQRTLETLESSILFANNCKSPSNKNITELFPNKDDVINICSKSFVLSC
jgi:hypothetical protein